MKSLVTLDDGDVPDVGDLIEIEQCVRNRGYGFLLASCTQRPVKVSRSRLKIPPPLVCPAACADLTSATSRLRFSLS